MFIVLGWPEFKIGEAYELNEINEQTSSSGWQVKKIVALGSLGDALALELDLYSLCSFFSKK